MNIAVTEVVQQTVTDTTHRIVTVAQLLADPLLSIPIYQRPYKWATDNVEQLFADIARNKDKSAYRLGTVVLHQDNDDSQPFHQLVDGQQRTITLLLIIRALLTERLTALKSEELKRQLLELQASMFKPIFANKDSQYNIRHNYQAIRRRVMRADFNEQQIDFLLNHCQLVRVILNDVSEAFQFFDAQNSRGRDLAPHDLLKAYHLREFDQADESLKVETVASWENSDSKQLALLFSQYLYRIRHWLRGKSARHFSKNDVALFKGANLAHSAAFPSVSALRIAHHTVDEYNSHFTRRIDAHTLAFPFQLDQTIINGRRFFEMTRHYHALIQSELIQGQPQKNSQPSELLVKLDGFAPEIFAVINSYSGRQRTGDGYVRLMFNCLLLYYYDKFGATELSLAVEKIFIWAYGLRLTNKVVQLASMDKHVLENNLFRELREAIEPHLFLQYPLPMLTTVNSSRTEQIAGLFKDMGYLDENKQ